MTPHDLAIQTDCEIFSVSPQKMETPFTDYVEVEKEERFDPEVMRILRKGIAPCLLDEPTAENIRKYHAVLHKYYGSKTGNAVKKVRYIMGAKTEEGQVGFPYGRIYAEGAIGLQALPRRIRSALAQKYYYDVDMEAAHFYLAVGVMRKANLLHTHTLDYIQNRKAHLLHLQQTYDLSRDDAKTLYTALLFTGRVKANEPASAHLKPLADEIHALMDYVWETYPWVQVVAKHKNSDGNLRGAALANYLQTEELKVLLVMDKHLPTIGRQADVLIHDGMLIRKKGRETTLPPSVLTSLEEEVLAKTGYTIRLVVKALDALPPDAVPLPVEDKDKDDMSPEQAAKAFLKVFYPYIRRFDDEFYFFNKGQWKLSNDFANDVCACISYRRQTVDPEFLGVYGSCPFKMGDIPKMLRTFKSAPVAPGSAGAETTDAQFLFNDDPLDLDTGYEKILFTNGIRDMVTGELLPHDPSVVFLKTMGYDWEPSTEEDMETLRRLHFADAFEFGNAYDTGDYLRKAYAQAVAGNYQVRNFYVCLGESTTGKGTVTHALEHAFGGGGGGAVKTCSNGFVGTWNSAAVTTRVTLNSNKEDALKMSWLLGAVGCRVLIANEADEKQKLDMTIIKALVSDGDDIKARLLHKNEVIIQNRSTLFALANEIGELPHVDTSVEKRMRFLQYTTSFSATPTEPSQRMLKPNVTSMAKERRWQLALYNLLETTYRDLPENKRRLPLDMPPSVQQSTRLRFAGADFIAQMETAGYTFSGNPNSVVRSQEIIEALGWSGTRVGREMKKHEVSGRVQGERYRGSRCYFGWERLPMLF